MVLSQQPDVRHSAAEAGWCLHFEGVGRTFGTRGRRGVEAIADVTLGARPREVVAVIGPSGCGKSTLLSLGAGLDRPTTGSVVVNGKAVIGPRPDVAFMLQKDLLLPWRTILENVTFGVEIRGLPQAEREHRAHDLLRRFGLEGFARAYPHQLSGGMRQRAALARTMALHPAVLLMDEPFSALDAQTKIKLQAELLSAVREREMTALVITHDLTEAVVLSDRIYVMSARPGRIIAEMKVELPASLDATERYFDHRTADYVRHLWSLLAEAERAATAPVR